MESSANDADLCVVASELLPGTFTYVRDSATEGYDTRGYSSILGRHTSGDNATDHPAYGWRPMLIEVP